MSLAGKLEEVELPELLHFLALNSRTGRVTINRRDEHGSVVVRQGRIVYAASSSVRETFGNILVCRGLVTPEALSAALERQHLEAGRRRLGEILVERGALSEEDLRAALAQQLSQVVQELCRWKTGYFRFDAGPVAESGDIGVDAEDFVLKGGVATEQVLIEAMTRMDEQPDPEPEPHPEPRSPIPLRMLASCAAPALRGEVTIGLLRRASTLVSRGLLLVVRGDEAHGAGQFGLDVMPDADERVRAIRLPLSEPSLIAEAVERRQTVRGPVPRTPANERLLELLGGRHPREAIVVPLLLCERVGLVLYGDDALDDKPLGSSSELEWALLEAGLAMERELLEQRLHDFEKARGFRP
jgi:hypothetical protein